MNEWIYIAAGQYVKRDAIARITFTRTDCTLGLISGEQIIVAIEIGFEALGRSKYIEEKSQTHPR